MTDFEQLAVDAGEIEQVVLNPGWRVIERKLNKAIKEFTEAVMVAPLADKERLCQRVLAYQELLNLPKEILDEFKEKKAQHSAELETTEA